MVVYVYMFMYVSAGTHMPQGTGGGQRTTSGFLSPPAFLETESIVILRLYNKLAGRQASRDPPACLPSHHRRAGITGVLCGAHFSLGLWAIQTQVLGLMWPELYPLNHLPAS